MNPEIEAELAKENEVIRKILRDLTADVARAFKADFVARLKQIKNDGDPDAYGKAVADFIVKNTESLSTVSACDFWARAEQWAAQVHVPALAQKLVDAFVNGDYRSVYEFWSGPANGIAHEATKVQRKAEYDALMAKRAAAESEKARRLAAQGKQICQRCGGAGGWSGWPGFTCFRCRGTGIDPKSIKKVVAK